MSTFPHKLGKQAPKHDPRTFCMARYCAALPPAPVSVDWTPKIGPLGMMANDRLGCCTIAASAHLIQSWTGNASGTPTIIPDDQVVVAYSVIDGYNPSDPSTDRGGVELDVLKQWRNNGLGPAGHAIAAFAALNPLNHEEVMQALNLFGRGSEGIKTFRKRFSHFSRVFHCDPCLAKIGDTTELEIGMESKGIETKQI